ncbi:MAG: PQQ-binding-like beta-propeller repeat protein [Planctomycetota bacterium]|nr:PQQ-binding-like beta-propeller repeat protein [Planctomycetota bacterium]MDA1138823.1 PQQ-binding-like beta-propeller repeat protein [Planctomycetota bacterium]
MRTIARFFLLISFLVQTSYSEEINWPGWRGPRGDGSTMNKGLPATWSSDQNIVWKAPVEGTGHASPIIWGDRLFTVSAIQETAERILVCLDRKTGKKLWQTTVLKTPFEKIHQLNSRASSTPVADGERVYVSFLDKDQMYIAAYDLDGNRLWESRPGVFSSVHGYCSSPILWKNSLIINGDHDGDAYIVALDKTNGETLWKTMRPNKTRSYCTPIIRNIDGRNQMILSGSKSVSSYDPDTGEQHWVIDGPTEQFVASLVYNGDLLFMTSGFPELHMLAIDPRGKGNVTQTHVRWRTTKGCSYVPSPISVGPYFLVVSDKGFATCFDAKTGEPYWVERIGKRYSASLISSNGLVYFLADDGSTTVVKAAEKYEAVAVNNLGENTYGSPAVSGNQIFIRGFEHIYCIGNGK